MSRTDLKSTHSTTTTIEFYKSMATSPISTFHQNNDNPLDEAIIDKFATLFSPETPRASPTLDPIQIDHHTMDQNSTAVTITKRPPSHHRNVSADSEFGAFVSVPVMKDPLAALDFELLPPSDAHESGSFTQKNSTLNFFDRFAKNAKVADERNRHDVLDELLMHEDDPLYWLKEQNHNSSGDYVKLPTPEPEPEPELHKSKEISPEPLVSDDASSSLHDVDIDFFSTKAVHPPPSTTQPRPNPTHSPTRSPTLPPPPTLAPPLADTSTASSPYQEFADPLSSNITNAPETSRIPTSRSDSYSTLTSLSSRWMSSFLPTSKSSNANINTGVRHAATPSLESLFALDAAAQPRNMKPASTFRTRITESEQHTQGVSTSISAATATAVHSHTHSHAYLPPPDVQITHGTPFGRTLKGSPFASHIYVPPSGAPGFKGEQYDWDKGFSAALELERESELIDAHGHGGTEDGLRDRGGDRETVILDQRDDVGVGKAGNNKEGFGSVGKFIERRGGGVELLGRKASTVIVLDSDLADMIRTHLPALARLPRKWTLLYSLDQHGISLNTLYARCEAASVPRPGVPASAGALVVIRDAGEGVFGVWMGGGEGVKMSRGKGYYGSGECFLWKCPVGKDGTRGEVKVFKWTGRNDYVALCEPEFISFGGGDGNYGLYLDDTLLDGSSARCPTFANEPLCSPSRSNGGVVKFECVGLEVWGVGP